MRVIILRHASRDPHGLGDPHLNKTGLRQAEELASRASSMGMMPQPSHLFCSPKNRAQETLRPLAETIGIQLQIDPRLDERRENESFSDFEKRVINSLNEIQNMGKTGPSSEKLVIYLCSHLDWLEAAMRLLNSDMNEMEISSSWSTCEYRLFRVQENYWHLKSQGVISPESWG